MSGDDEPAREAGSGSGEADAASSGSGAAGSGASAESTGSPSWATSETGPILSPSPQPAFGPGTGRDGGPAPGWDDPDRAPTSEQRRAAAAGVLDRPVDDVSLRDRLARPGMARSTRILLLILGAVVFFGLGGLVGRATAPATGPGSVPPTVGVVEAVDVTPSGFPVLTVRAPDGTLTPLQTTAGTVVAVPRGTGLQALHAGQQVTITGERDQRGQVIATRVDLPTP